MIEIALEPAPEVTIVPMVITGHRIVFTEACHREWQYYVMNAPGEISVMAEVTEDFTAELKTFIISKLHMVKQRNTTSYTEMDEYETNKLFSILALEDKENTLYCWIHSHYNFGVFISGVDQANIDSWFRHGGKRLLTVISNRAQDFLAQYSEKNTNGVVETFPIKEVLWENQWQDSETDWKKNIDTLCMYSSHGRMSEHPVTKHVPEYGYEDESEAERGDREVAEQIRRFTQRERRPMRKSRQYQMNFDNLSTTTLNLDMKRIRIKIAELNDMIDTIPFGSGRYSDISQEIFAAECELANLQRQHFKTVTGGKS